MNTRLLVVLSLSLLAAVAVGRRPSSHYPLTLAQKCELRHLSSSQPSERVEFEGGVIELWNEDEDQFQCAGVAPLRITLRPNSLSLPNFRPAPRLLYVLQGQALLGVNFPGCAETFHSGQSTGKEEEQTEKGGERKDLHQKVRRVSRGDVVAIPQGVAHWFFNDGNEDLVTVSVTDLNHQANQLDQKLRVYYLAGRPQRQEHLSEQARQSFQNIFNAFDEQLMAEALNVPVDLVRKMQKEDPRGLIVQVREGISMIRPDERGEEQEPQQEWRLPRSNGIEETACTMRLQQNIDDRRDADVYCRHSGRLNIVNQHNLPILRDLDMSAERGNLLPNALYTPHWSMNGHGIVYATRGEAEVQVVDNRGQSVMSERVSEGNMFVVPQFFAVTVKAGNNGFEWLNFKTTSVPMRSPLAGYSSVVRATPLQVLTNAYQISPSEAKGLKYNRGGQSFLLSPKRS